LTNKFALLVTLFIAKLPHDFGKISFYYAHDA